VIGAGIESVGGERRVAVAVRRGGRTALVRVTHATHGAPIGIPGRPQRVLAALPLARTTHRMLELPFTDDATLAQVVPLELRGQLPADPGAARIGFQVIERTHAGTRVLALLVREHDLDAAAAAAAALGTPAAGVVPAPLALGWLLPAGFSGTVVLACGTESSVSVWEAGRPRALRALAADARHAAALADEIGWSLQAIGAGDGPLVIAGADASPALLQQCRRFDATAGALPLDHLALDVDRAEILAAPVACGLALGALDVHAPLPFPLAAGTTPLWTPRVRRLVMAAMVLAAFDVGVAKLALARRAARVEAALVAEARRALPNEPIVAPRAQLEAAARSARHDGAAAYGGALARLREVSERIPDGLAVDLTRLSLDGERLQLTGTADTFEAVDVLRRSLTASPRLRDVATDEVRTTVDGKRVGFHVRARWVAAGEASS